MKLRNLAPLALVSALAACGGAAPPARAPTVAALRDQARGSSDGEVVGRWALTELVAPGGQAKEAAAAHSRLVELKARGLYASLARGITDEAHGDPVSAADAFAAALKAAKTSDDPDAALLAWYASHALLGLRGSVAELWTRHKATFEDLLANPGRIGWRAVRELSEWWAAEAFDKAETTGDSYDAMVAAKLGCARAVRLAGPFGSGAGVDARRSFPAEGPTPWPGAWAADPLRGTVPHQLKVEQHRCTAASVEHAPDGVYYAETFFRTNGDKPLLVSAQGSLRIWVDDALVLERDPRDWGSLQRHAAAIQVGAGRHRVLVRLVSAGTAIRLLDLEGRAADVATDADPAPGYVLQPPRLLASPNPIDAYVRAAPRASEPIPQFFAAEAAHADQLDDVAAVLVEPIVSPKDAASIALAAASRYAHGDSALPEDVRQRAARALRDRALRSDPRLWEARALLVLEDAEQRGLSEAIEPLRKLVEEFKAVPELQEQLARLYGRLGWRAERMRAFADLAARFPDDLGALRMYHSVLEEDGPLAEADRVAARIKKLDPDAELDLSRAIARHDWPAAIAELRRLGKRRPDRKEIIGRIAGVLSRAGDPTAAVEQLSAALKKDPQDASVRFRLADRAFAKGDTSALRHALADALQAGSDASGLRAAIDLIEGATDLEPYRIDGRKVIREFEAWERSGKHMDGNAARVLDYATTWVHPDGSSEMLEHEIQKVQSQEAVSKESEIPPPEGLVLRLRVIKPDGTTLEPEQVAGKERLTLPHLAVGDYIEVEHVVAHAGDGQKGRRYRGPHWFFREADKGYWRSEFVVVTPKDKPIEIETRGNVGAVQQREFGTYVERRWRVDLSPPVPEEDESPPPQEFLPSVRVGWGFSVPDTLERLWPAAADDTPLDPRLRAKAEEIVRGIPAQEREARARNVYRWVVDHVQDGKETDGRRVVMGGSGSRHAAFQHLIRQLGIPVELALVKNKLATPPLGRMSEIENFDGVLLRLTTEKGVRWLQVREKFAPFGYVPAPWRGQPAYRLIEGTPRDDVSAGGAADGVSYVGRADVRENGAATVQIVIEYTGNRAISWRAKLAKISEAQLYDFVDNAIVGPAFDGGHAREVKIENRADLDRPLILRVRVEVPQLAKVTPQGLLLKPAFAESYSQLATLPQRQTPLLRPGSHHVEVRFEVVFPESMRMPATLPTGEARNGEAVVAVRDAVRGHAIALERETDIPAGRVQPGDDYAKYVQFARDAEALVSREILVGR